MINREEPVNRNGHSLNGRSEILNSANIETTDMTFNMTKEVQRTIWAAVLICTAGFSRDV